MTATVYPLPRETRESAILVGNGTVGPYAASAYKVFDTVDVKVFAKALGETFFSDVTAGCTIAKVNPAAAYDFFTVTFGASVPATTSWYHQARRVAERSVAVTRGGTLDSNQLEKELSKQASVESEVRRDLDRAVMVEVGTDPIVIIPGADGTLAKFEGRNIVPGPNADDIAADAEAAAASAAAAGTSATNSANSAASAGDAATAAAGSAASAATNAGILASLVAGFAAIWLTILQTTTLAAAWLALNVVGVVASKTALKAIVPSVGMAVYSIEANRRGRFIWTLGDFTAHAAADPREGVYVKATSVAVNVGMWVRQTEWISPFFFGAVGDDTADDNQPLNDYHTLLMFGTWEGRINGKFKSATALNWDFSGRRLTGVVIKGKGPNLSYINVTDTTTSPAFRWHANSQPLFYAKASDFGIRTNRAGVGFQIGQDDLVDAWNQCVFSNIVVNNAAANAANVSLRLNHILGTEFNMTANAGGSGKPAQPGAPGYGTAVEFRQVDGCHGVIHAGNSVIGHRYTAGFNYGNTWGATNIEEVTTAIVVDGGTCQHNSYKGGYFVASTMLNSSVGSDNELDNPNISYYAGGSFGGNVTGWSLMGIVTGSVLRRTGTLGMGIFFGPATLDPQQLLHLYAPSGTVAARFQSGTSTLDISMTASGTFFTNFVTGGGFNFNAASSTGYHAYQVNSVEVGRFDVNGLLVAGKIISNDATKGIGYGTGAGGTVVQATSKATGVTLNKATGQITMNAAALAAATIVSFVLTDSAIAATDILVLNHISGGTPGSYGLNARCAAGSATIDVRNNSAGSLSEAIVISFAVIKAVTA